MASIIPHARYEQLEEIVENLEPQDVLVLKKGDGTEIVLVDVQEEPQPLSTIQEGEYDPALGRVRTIFDTIQEKHAAELPEGNDLNFRQATIVSGATPNALEEDIAAGKVTVRYGEDGERIFDRKEMEAWAQARHEAFCKAVDEYFIWEMEHPEFNFPQP